VQLSPRIAGFLWTKNLRHNLWFTTDYRPEQRAFFESNTVRKPFLHSGQEHIEDRLILVGHKPIAISLMKKNKLHQWVDRSGFYDITTLQLVWM
jgi:hypothetical protein